MKKLVRWRSMALLLLTAIFCLNMYVFLTLPSHRQNDLFPEDFGPVPKQYDSRGISHLQAPRKRLNKSNFTSESVGADGNGGGAEGGGAWEEGVGDHSPLAVPDQGGKKLNIRNDNHVDGKADIVRLQQEKRQHVAERPQDEQVIDKGGKNSVSDRNNFMDPKVDAFLKLLEEAGKLDVPPGQSLQTENYWMFLKRQRLRRKAGMTLKAFKSYKAKTNWERFHKGIHQHFLYNPEDPMVENLLKDLTHRSIDGVEQKEGGTQIKLIITFDDIGHALFKPMRMVSQYNGKLFALGLLHNVNRTRHQSVIPNICLKNLRIIPIRRRGPDVRAIFPRETETLPDHFYFADYERHVAEIGAFHLDRVLGYNRVPPVAGRLFNVTYDIRRLADSKLAKTFFVSPAGNICFHGHCSYYCDSSHPICGHPDQLEASLMAFLPPEKLAHRQTWRNPWKRSYSKHRKAYWEAYDDLCEKLQERAPYNSGRRLLDIIDMSVLDFLMGNLDRHHYETFREFGNETFIIHLDNGRGFGKAHQDDLSCLAPMLQCCMIRLSTLQRLARLYGGEYPLSTIMRMSMSMDQITPILIEPHLQALDRRLLRILQEVLKCSAKEGRTLNNVIVDDGVY